MSIILSSPSGMQAEFNRNGSLSRFTSGAISVLLFPGNELEGGPANLYLRSPGRLAQWLPLLGPSSHTRFTADVAGARLIGTGEWLGVSYRVVFRLAQAATAWFWHVSLHNHGAQPVTLDLTYAQDLALAPYGAVRMNEFYVSQYLDHTPLTEATHGTVIASRQNAAADGHFPWSLIGSLRSAVSYATDALQFYGLNARAGLAPAGLLADLPGRRLQHEHAMIALQDKPIELLPGSRADAGFWGTLLADHPAATATSDLAHLKPVLSLPESTPDPVTVANEAAETSAALSAADSTTLFCDHPFLNGRRLEHAALTSLFATPWRQEERDDEGLPLSFFYGAGRHVVLQGKEFKVLRPHGHLLRTGRHLTPDETGLTSTVWMSGVFHSMLTQGHVSINRMLSTAHTYLGLFRSHGQRIFIEQGGTWHQLGVPSAFEMTPDVCRWVYRLDECTVEVRTEAHSDPHEMRLLIDVTAGAPARFLISHHVALNGDDGSAPGAARWRRDRGDIVLTPEPGGEIGSRFPNGGFRIGPLAATQFELVGGDELLFRDQQTRQQPFVVIVTSTVKSAGLRISGELVEQSTPAPLRMDDGPLIPTLSILPASDGAAGRHAAALADIVPWFTQNALVHYLSPRGLEQYSGGGWGTRDVCQGPVEMLLALNRTAPIRDLLLRVFRQQNPDGDWPQWFMFFDRERGIRPGDSHGDVVFWPLVALAQYLIASGDAGLLDECIPFYDAGNATGGKTVSIWDHVERALEVIEKRVIPGTALAAYGHGDWNDSLQPADPRLREHMCSAWTVTLNYQMLNTLALALRGCGRTLDAAGLESTAQRVLNDFQRKLIVDGVLTGYAVFDTDAVRYLLHPSDRSTGLHYSALAMIHAILEDMLTPPQVRSHLDLIDTYLSGPDGVRLFDRPMTYHGGPQQLFQRAESATYFGREIGLMYMHAHLRYAQAMAHIGNADRFFQALCQANPIGIDEIVARGTLRQANCYYSSSDAAFSDRYHASDEYDRVRAGTIDLDGGWRVYSSGAGISLALIMRRFLGLSVEAKYLSVDPVMPLSLDGLRVQTHLLGRPLDVTYKVGRAGCGVSSIELNGHRLAFGRRTHRYRPGAADVPLASVRECLTPERNTMTVSLG
jgi:1,2-beta-oligoglucan phosphorylase